MKGHFFGAFVVVALGAFIMATPFWFFPVCQDGVAAASGAVLPMKCHWMARSELGCGAVVVFAGLALLFAGPAVRKGVALMLLPLGALVILLPTRLVGVCKSEMMPCHMGTLPALCLLGGATVAVGAAILLRLRAEAVLRAERDARQNGRENP